MKVMTRRLCVLLTLLIITGCARSQHKDPRPHAWLKPGVDITLPPPSMTPAIISQQLLTSRFKGNTQSLLVMLNADKHKLSLVGLSALGIRLFLVTYDAAGIHTEQTITISQLPPANQVLADVMLSYWPVNVWQPQLPVGWTLVDSDNQRKLRDEDGNLVYTIQYQQKNKQRIPISIQHHVFGYLITIQHLDD